MRTYAFGAASGGPECGPMARPRSVDWSPHGGPPASHHEPDGRDPGRSAVPPLGLGVRGEGGRLAGARLQGRRRRAPGEPAGARSHAAVPGARGCGQGPGGADATPGRRDRGLRSPAPLAVRMAPRPASRGDGHAAHADRVRLPLCAREGYAEAAAPGAAERARGAGGRSAVDPAGTAARRGWVRGLGGGGRARLRGNGREGRGLALHRRPGAGLAQGEGAALSGRRARVGAEEVARRSRQLRTSKRAGSGRKP